MEVIISIAFRYVTSSVMLIFCCSCYV